MAEPTQEQIEYTEMLRNKFKVKIEEHVKNAHQYLTLAVKELKELDGKDLYKEYGFENLGYALNEAKNKWGQSGINHLTSAQTLLFLLAELEEGDEGKDYQRDRRRLEI
jgi:hypothetical protein